MKGFHSIIRENLEKFSGIVNKDERVEEIYNLLCEVSKKGFDKLVKKFCAQKDSDRAYDILFEIWICRILLQNASIKELKYEPTDEECPPDFRFVLNQTSFALQVKRLTNIYNEIIKSTFAHECRKQLSEIHQSWSIHYGISNDFNRKNINPFFQYIRENLNNFTILPSMDKVLKSPKYYWPDDENKLVAFSFSEKTKKENNFISIGITFSDVYGIKVSWVDIQQIRKSVKRILKKSRPTLYKRISPKQSNLVIMKTSSEIWLDNDDVLDVLYGNEGLLVSMKSDGFEDSQEVRARNGLLRSDTFSTISGFIFVPQEITLFDKELKGAYFPHPEHLGDIQTHPKPFPKMPFCYPSSWNNN